MLEELKRFFPDGNMVDLAVRSQQEESPDISLKLITEIRGLLKNRQL